MSPDRGDLWAERRALAILAVQYTAPERLSQDASARDLAQHRQACRIIAARRGGIRIEERGAWTILAFGLDSGGRVPLHAARQCASEIHQRQTTTVGVDAGVTTVWRLGDGTACLVVGPVVESALRLATAGGLNTGSTLAALSVRKAASSPVEHTVLQLLAAARTLAIAGDDVRTLRAIAAIGEPVDIHGLSVVLGIEPGSFGASLAALIEKKLVTTSGDGAFAVVSEPKRQHVLWTMPRDDRLGIAKCFAEHLSREFTRRPGFTLARRAAEAFERAECWAKAFKWWRHSAEFAVREGRQPDVLQALRRALRFARRTGDTAGYVAVAAELASVLGALRGNADPEVVRIYRSCLGPCRQSPPDQREHEFDVMFGLQASHLVRGEIAEARSIGSPLVVMASDGAAKERRSLAHRLLGLTLFLDGDIAAARVQYRSALDHYVEAVHAALRSRFASDQKALALAGLAWLEAVAGSYAASEELAAEAENYAARIEHPHTSAHVASVLATRAQMLGTEADALRLATWANNVSVPHGLTYWHAWSEAILGWADCRADMDSGAIRLDSAIRRYRETGSAQAMPFMLMMKADVQMAAGALADAGVTLARAERYTRAGGVRLYRAEVFRSAARVARMIGDRAAALRLARKAFGTAVAGGADLFCSLAVAEIAASSVGTDVDVDRLVSTVKSRLS